MAATNQVIIFHINELISLLSDVSKFAIAALISTISDFVAIILTI